MLHKNVIVAFDTIYPLFTIGFTIAIGSLLLLFCWDEFVKKIAVVVINPSFYTGMDASCEHWCCAVCV